MPGVHKIHPNVANLCRGKTRQNAPDVVARSLGQAEAYLNVREVLAEASTGTDGVQWREFSGFGRFRSATLGFTPELEKRLRRHEINLHYSRFREFANKPLQESDRFLAGFDTVFCTLLKVNPERRPKGSKSFDRLRTLSEAEGP